MHSVKRERNSDRAKKRQTDRERAEKKGEGRERESESVCVERKKKKERKSKINRQISTVCEELLEGKRKRKNNEPACVP